MMTFSPKACSLEPELDQLYTYETYKQVGYDAKPDKITNPGWKWIDLFHEELGISRGLDRDDLCTKEWQEKFDDMGLPYDCTTKELDVDKLCLDRATKYMNQ